MNRLILIAKIIILLVIPVLSGFAQTGNTKIDSILTKIQYYGVKKSSSILFSHFDKTIYVNNEDAWFTTYLLNYDKQKNSPSILTMILVSDWDKSPIIERHFPMSDGLAFGHFIIPDGLQPGNYSFIVYTNILADGKPMDVFTQPVTIKTSVKPRFPISMTLKPGSGDSIAVLLKVTSPDGGAIAGAMIQYGIGTDSEIAKTDADGQYLVKIPHYRITPEKNVLHAEVSYNKETRTVSLTLPTTHRLNIKFYPEGGQLVNGTLSVVGWEAKSPEGSPLKLSAILYKDKSPVDTIFTDSFGMGSFKLMPFAGSSYEVKIINKPNDAAFSLPVVLGQGPVINLKKGLCDDSLKIRILNNEINQFFLIIHDYTHYFYAFPFVAGTGGKNILINLADLPRGLHTITVLDSIGRPLAERLFFAHYNRETPLQIRTDHFAYKPKQRVNFSIKLGKNADEATKGIVSIACVESSRLDPAKSLDIESYTFLRNELGSIPVGMKDKDELENVLLIKGWRKYTWHELARTTAKDTLLHIDSIQSLSGVVSVHGGLVKEPVNLTIINDSTSRIITTNRNGRFSLGRNLITTKDGKQIQLVVSNSRDYSIEVKSRFDEVNDLLIHEFQLRNEAETPIESSTNSLALADLNHIFNLQEVVIKGGALRREDGSLYSQKGPNGCGDYVCKENILNCVVHTGDDENRPAKEGGIYGIMMTHHGEPVDPPLINGKVSLMNTFTNFQNDSYQVVTYLGCKKEKKIMNTITLNGIYISKEFYPVDFSKSDTALSTYPSTLFWKHLCFLNSKLETSFSFFTGDIKGSFKIIVQGITGDNKIYGETEFTVSP